METSGRADGPVEGPPDNPSAQTPPVAPAVPPVAPPLPPPGPPVVPPVAPTTEPGSSGGLTGGDWPAQVTDTIVDLVGTVRDKTTGPITTVARGVVLGLFAAVMAVMVAVIAIIALVRLLDEALPSSVWLPYLILGAVFVLAGALVYRRRRAPA
ncbi:hypothetical protein [Rhabdothermincola salaria]|uniref:hypothetical protein n=1 Tax=Rhabdothermincola salaria TaxID=2903142 RepID=UPI001E323B31|nr:hypothetical protein [Rhabdothermincola salaria]MCD9624458.1 hypothetical protein [Rhabdothermincola salaria]